MVVRGDDGLYGNTYSAIFTWNFKDRICRKNEEWDSGPALH
jgi:hypothetical protein